MASNVFSPKAGGIKALATAVETQGRLKKCWSEDINWNLYPSFIKQGCEQIGKASSIPPTAVLSGIITLVSFGASHGKVNVPDTDWSEPILLWVAVGMPTGSGKSSLFKYLLEIIRKARTNKGLNNSDPSWLLEEATFEKMGVMMSQNHSKLLGLYDELSTFLTQINLYKGRALSDSHDLALFLQLYNGHPWTRSTVTGEANFSMDCTSLTVGGFTQPAVARPLIELPSSIEKGFSSRFLWCFPKPCYASFDTLEPVDSEFTDNLVGLISTMWIPDSKAHHHFNIPQPCTLFREKFNNIQEQLKSISGMDELLSGMLSKSKGIILRLAAVLHILFHIETPNKIPQEICPDAIRAAINYVDMCCQHAAHIAGRGDIAEAILHLQTAKEKIQTRKPLVECAASYMLTLPGKVLDISVLNTSRKFREFGNKDGAVAAIKLLQESGIGVVHTEKATRGTSKLYKYEKPSIPEDQDVKEEFCANLAKFGVSLKEFEEALKTPKKRQNPVEAEHVRRSPRLGASPIITSTPSKQSTAKRNLFGAE